jgi:hypothetical protein
LLLSPSRETASEVKKDMEKLKGQLIEALSSKGESILNGNDSNVKQTPSSLPSQSAFINRFVIGR